MQKDYVQSEIKAPEKVTRPLAIDMENNHQGYPASEWKLRQEAG